uniref:Cytochrome P450 n=1 Tax=Phaedon brassicae TaxID=154011 RepID=A0A9Y1LQ03_9CUCU|nr:cytochrome P450 [Phaedon brassicae]
MWWIILISLSISLFYYLITINSNYWRKRSVPGPDPWPLIGNIGSSLIGRLSAGEIFTNIYRKYEGYPFVGIFRATTPALLVRDPDFVKNVLVKDFKNFHDNDIHIDKEVDPIMGRNPFILKGAEWKTTRVQLTSCFTSGKVKGMYPLIRKSSERMVRYVEDETSKSSTMESRELCIRFTLDNVASCAFGLEGKSFDEPYSSFRRMADEFLSPDNFWMSIKSTSLLLFPALTKFLKVKFTSDQLEEKLIGMVTATLKYRKENNVIRNDFLEYVSQLKDGGNVFTEVDITAHAASFFGDGYETSSRVMSFLLFELATNPRIQETLRKEIIESYRKNNDSFTYESVQEMSYLDACFNENVRKNSIAHYLTKLCTEKYTYTPTNPEYKKMSVTLDRGTPVIIPITGLHKDPKYFESPDEFKPERFIDKDNIQKFTYLPFGEGPRVCIGQRFGITQIKVGIVHLIKNYRVTVNQKTQLPLKYDPWFIMLHAIGGLWIDLHKIE